MSPEKRNKNFGGKRDTSMFAKEKQPPHTKAQPPQLGRFRKLLLEYGFEYVRDTTHEELWKCKSTKDGSPRKNCTVGINLNLRKGKKGSDVKTLTRTIKSDIRRRLTQTCDPKFAPDEIETALSTIQFMRTVDLDDPIPGGKTLDELLDWCVEDEDETE